MKLVIACLALALTGALLGTLPATATTVPRVYVHAQPGQWAYESPRDARDILTPPGTSAQRKFDRLNPGDRIRFAGATRGLFKVTAVIDIAKTKAQQQLGKGRAWDRALHVKHTNRWVYTERIRT